MQDNRNIEQLGDQAWAKMKDLLDQEMPVQSDSKRPFAFWWIYLAAAILLIGTVGFLFFQSADVPEWSEGIVQNAPVADLTATGIAPEKTNPVSDPGEPAPMLEKLPETLRPEKSTTTLKASLAVPEKDNIRSGNVAVSSGPSDRDQPITIGLEKEEKEIASGTGNRASEQEATGLPIDQSIAGNLLPTERPADVAKKENDLELLNLALLSERPLAALEQAPLPLVKTHRYDHKMSLFIRPEINAGIMGSLSPGAFSGLLVEARSGLKLHDAGKWSFQLGVGLHHQQTPFRISFQNSVSKDQVAAEITGQDQQNGGNPLAQNAGGVSIPQAVASGNIQLQSLYFDVPLLLDWQFAARWSVAAGSRLSWLMSSVWKNSGGSYDAQFSGNNARYSFDLSNADRQFSLYQAGNNNTPTTFLLNDFYASGTLGITFRPHANRHLRLQYQHSMTNLLKSEVYQRTDRSLWLSAGIRF